MADCSLIVLFALRSLRQSPQMALQTVYLRRQKREITKHRHQDKALNIQNSQFDQNHQTGQKQTGPHGIAQKGPREKADGIIPDRLIRYKDTDISINKNE